MKPLSWSELNLFETDRDGWYRSYVLGLKEPPTDPMIRGSHIHEYVLQGKKPTYPPAEEIIHELIKDGFEKSTAELRRKDWEIEWEFEMRTSWNGIPLIGYFDGLSEHAIIELKTGSATWSKNKALGHGQLAFYQLMLPLEVLLVSASTKTGKVVSHTVPVDKDRLEAIQGRIERAWEEMGELKELRLDYAHRPA